MIIKAMSVRERRVDISPEDGDTLSSFLWMSPGNVEISRAQGNTRLRFESKTDLLEFLKRESFSRAMKTAEGE